MGSIQHRVLGQWGPAPWMWVTAGAGATHTLVREQGQRRAASSWHGGSAVVPSAGPACTSIHVCSLPPISEDGLFLRPRELGVAPSAHVLSGRLP